MELAPILLKKARQWRNFCHVRDYGAASAMAELCLGPKDCVYDRASETYWIRELDLRLTAVHHKLLSGLRLAVALKRAGVNFTNRGGESVVDTGAFRVPVESGEQLFILNEIIVHGVYNVVSARRGSIVLDVGMNVAYASLYFAAQPWVEAVWSYEPVPETYGCALRNLGRNPTLATKIIPHNFGLGASAGKVTFEYCSELRGLAGISGLNPEFRRSFGVSESDIKNVSVDVRDVCSVIKEVRSAYPRSQVIVKIDGEGAEYPIIAVLRRDGLLREVDAFLIEWHRHGPRELEQTLTAAGFFVLSLTPHTGTAGMLYAHICVDRDGSAG